MGGFGDARGHAVLAQVQWILLFLFLQSCGTPEDRPDSRPPPIDPAAVPDAVPRADPIGRAGNTSPYEINGVTYQVMEDAAGYEEVGVASWYGLKFHGRATANGERFSVYQPTAAHRSLPIPTYVSVTNLENGRRMVLRVNDRGPFHGDRLIDLSYGAALKLGFAEQGTARVRVTALPVAGAEDLRNVEISPGPNLLQLGAYASLSSAEALAGQVRALTSAPVSIEPVDTQTGRLHRVRLGPYSEPALLIQDQRALRAAGLPEGKAVREGAL
ncbi:MAG: septal ring lytic transglycosylase RlpA family protein [Luminiphilus sp.]